MCFITEAGGLPPAGADDVLSGGVEDTAVICKMVLEDAALALLAGDDHGDLLARGVNGRLKPGRPGTEYDHVVAIVLWHGGYLLDRNALPL
jgi:hypothetical protein